MQVGLSGEKLTAIALSDSHVCPGAAGVSSATANPLGQISHLGSSSPEKVVVVAGVVVVAPVVVSTVVEPAPGVALVLVTDWTGLAVGDTVIPLSIVVVVVVVS